MSSLIRRPFQLFRDSLCQRSIDVDVLAFGNIHTVSTEVVTKFPSKISVHDLELLLENIAKVLSKIFSQAFISSAIFYIDRHTKTYIGLGIQISGTLRKYISKFNCMFFINVALGWVKRDGQQNKIAAAPRIGGKRRFCPFWSVRR